MTQDKTGKLLEFLKPIFDEAMTDGRECHISVIIKRHQVDEIIRQIKESSSAGNGGDFTIFVFKRKKVL